MIDAFTLAEIQERRRILRELNPTALATPPCASGLRHSPEDRPGASGSGQGDEAVPAVLPRRPRSIVGAP